MSLKSIAIIGAGNGGCAAAVEFTQLGYDVRLYGRSASTVEPLIARGASSTRACWGTASRLFRPSRRTPARR